jgi:hypothetical protein
LWVGDYMGYCQKRSMVPPDFGLKMISRLIELIVMILTYHKELLCPRELNHAFR